MNSKQMCVANVQYKKPTAEGAKSSGGLLRYLTYRDGRYGHIQQEAGMERWVNRGLGGSVRDIAARCDALKSQHVLAFTLVFNANPDLMAMVPLQQREQFVRELTETSLDRFFEARGVEGGVEYSYVLHHRESADKQAPGLHDPHTHVILPGTYFNEGRGERDALYFSRNKQGNHIELLHRATEQTLHDLMDREIGPDWEQRYDALELTREQQRAITQTVPHGKVLDEQGRQWDAWLGERRTDDGRTAVGYYRQFPHDPKTEQTTFKSEELDLEFRPLAKDLSHAQAATLAAWTAQCLKGHPTQDFAEMLSFIGEVGIAEDNRREGYVQDMAQELAAIHAHRQALADRERERHIEPPARSHDIEFF